MILGVVTDGFLYLCHGLTAAQFHVVGTACPSTRQTVGGETRRFERKRMNVGATTARQGTAENEKRNDSMHESTCKACRRYENSSRVPHGRATEAARRGKSTTPRQRQELYEGHLRLCVRIGNF